ncbi:MAG: response regulator [Mogibacterium sp.]|nr:response regulator [Mogibacterium sp.]
MLKERLELNKESEAVLQAMNETERVKEENRRLIAEIESAAELGDLMSSIASLLTNMPAMSFSKDAKTGRYLACNQSFAEYAHKSSPEEVVGLTDFEIFDPVTAAHFVEDDRKSLEMDEPYVFFEDVPDAGGETIRNLQTTKMKFTDAVGRLCTLGMCVDVTEMTRIKTAEAEARAKQQELEGKLELQGKLLQQEKDRDQQDKLITALSSDYRSVYYVDLDRDEGICYQEHPDLPDGLKTGQHFPFREVFGAYAEAYIQEQYREEFLNFIRPETIRENLKSGRVSSYRYVVERNGTESYEMVRFAGVRHPEDRDDHMVHAVGACFADVDEETRKTLTQNQTLLDALASAEQASRAKSSFLSRMSHEIRTPMNAIIGLNGIALQDPETPEHTREYLKKIGASADHLLSIINDILDMSRIESGRMVLRREPFSLYGVLEQVNTIIGGQCREKGLRYESKVNGRLADCYFGDDMKLRQIMINILGNAVKFTPEGGTVCFITEEIAGYEGRATIRMTFRDTGIGMSREYLPRIYDTFSQEDGSTTSRYGSTGLGMPITKNLVERMNGTIEVESEKGKGTTFTVTVTLDEAPEAGGPCEPHEDTQLEAFRHTHRKGQEGSSGGKADLNGRRVLLAEDMEINAEIMTMILSARGIETDHAGNGRIAVERFAASEPGFYDAILMDMRMPEMDGLEATRAIRAMDRPDAAQVPIIALTANAFDEDVQRSMQAGLNAHLSKPVEADRLYETLEDLIR